MKVNVFLTLLSILVVTLIGYLVFNVAEGDENDVLCGIVGCICFGVTLVPVMGIQYEAGRQGVNIRIFSTLFFIVFLISHFSFAAFGVREPYYIVTNGILLIIYMALFYKMQGIKDV